MLRNIILTGAVILFSGIFTFMLGQAAPATYLLLRGDWDRHGEELAPGFPSILNEKPPQIIAPGGKMQTSGRRSALAQWLTAKLNL